MTQPNSISSPSDTQDAEQADGGVGYWKPAIETALDKACQFESGCPPRLREAIRYAVLAPGKRLRPALVLMAAEACGGSAELAMPGAVAVEMIHAYSLIHDDLPAMDDDDLRRGRPTVHIAFDEATAILAGDALQPLAFEHLCSHVAKTSVAIEALAVLSRAAGPSHLVGGQADDLAADSASGLRAENSLDAEPDLASAHTSDKSVEHLESIHRRKTGALFSAAIDMGAILSEAAPKKRVVLSDYAAVLGLAFQVVDDLLDYTSDAEILGKRSGKDADRGKLTYPSLLGLDGAREKAQSLIEQARRHLLPLGKAAWRLDALAQYVLDRTH